MQLNQRETELATQINAMFEGCTDLLDLIVAVLEEVSLPSKEDDMSLKVDTFMEIITFFSFEKLAGKTLLDYYHKITNSRVIDFQHVFTFVYGITTIITKMNIEADVTEFMEKEIPKLQKMLQKKKLTMGTMNLMHSDELSQFRIKSKKSVVVIANVLKKYKYILFESEEERDKTALDVQVILCLDYLSIDDIDTYLLLKNILLGITRNKLQFTPL